VGADVMRLNGSRELCLRRNFVSVAGVYFPKMSWALFASTVLAAISPIFFGAAALAQDGQALATQLANPLASLISVPFQFNYDSNIGPSREGDGLKLNVQPVIPFKLDANWTLISRTIVPVIYQNDVAPGSGQQFGLADTVQSFFLSPSPTPLGGEAKFIWGAGPVLLLPTGTSPLLTAHEFGTGPTGVALIQQGPWTVGVLTNHIWSIGNQSAPASLACDDYACLSDPVDAPSGRAGISATYIQPFISYTTKDAWTFGLNTESTYDWFAEKWTIPVNATVSKLMMFGKQPVSLGVGVRYWAETPEGGPHGFGARAIVTFLFPSK
jgi:hypothetical protein